MSVCIFPLHGFARPGRKKQKQGGAACATPPGPASTFCDCRKRHFAPRKTTVAASGSARRAVRQKNFRPAEQPLRLVTDATPGPVPYIDHEQRYRFVNRQYENGSSIDVRDVHEAYAFGANSHLVKPADPNDLTRIVDAIRSCWLELNAAPPQPGDDPRLRHSGSRPPVG